ncbi:hypothetical protein JTE90_028647 [Oedothorax gibbosus]|uniref:Peroxidase n=1 Tax=Oedothorax gibbosus TaxID=931172 RepID=A0AAV6UY69_9ARAC|nr:hypothetical protein JTE90_028647 [Oedothorax gibbosus]
MYLLVFLGYALLACVPMSCSVIREPSEFIEIPDKTTPAEYLAMLHNPSEQELLINRISEQVLKATKDLLSLSPRSSRVDNVSISARLLRMQELHPREVIKLLESQGVSVPPLQPPMSCDFAHFYRTADGRCNNLKNPCWGKTDEPYRRWLPPVYGDGLTSPRIRVDGRPLPSPRQVYQWVSSQWQQTTNSTLPHLTSLVTMWGQTLAHDLILTPTIKVTTREGNKTEVKTPECCPRFNATGVTWDGPYHEDCFPIRMNYEDGFYRRGHCLDMLRSAAYVYNPDSCTPISIGRPREQMNQLTSFLDASVVYGSTEDQMRRLRENHGRGAKLMVDAWNCPLRKDRECKVSHRVCDKRCFHAGEGRANENPVLASLHIIWMREHNRIVDLLSHKPWSQDTLFHVARKIVGALLQHITYGEYLPAILGHNLVRHMNLFSPSEHGYRYDDTVDPSIYNVFSAAAFRYGHSMVDSRLMRKSMGYSASPLLSQDFFSVDDFCEPKGDPLVNILEGQADQRAQSVDCLFSTQLTQHLFAPIRNGIGQDLFSINIQRGRDHGIPPYTKWRDACQLKPVHDYSDLRGEIPDHILERIKAIYGTHGVHEVDLYVGGVSELPVNGGILGRTLTCIVSNQFSALKFGDRFWYENLQHPGALSAGQIAQIQKTTLAGVLCRNSDIRQIQRHAFFVEAPNNPKWLFCKTIGPSSLTFILYLIHILSNNIDAALSHFFK